MARTVGSTNRRSLEFISKFDNMCLVHKDPVEVLFRLLKSRKQSVQIQAARELMQYRYPKLAAAHLQVEGPNQLSLGWDLDHESLQLDIKPNDSVIAEIEALAEKEVMTDE